jgi:tRNA (guanosine-2'-O-)-methyltransferase
VVLEDIYQPQNASAVLRSCDCFGIQDVHIIENRNKFRINPSVTLGSDKWLTIIKYKSDKDNTLQAIEEIKNEGYRIVATTPHSESTELKEFDLLAGKTALFFGTELEGISEDVSQNADVFLKIPMFGFTESYNVSVSVAIILYTLISKLHASDITWQLTEEERKEIKLMWLKNSIKKSDAIEREFYRSQFTKQNNK